MSNIERAQNNDFFNKITKLLQEARKSVVRTINQTIVYTYYEIGRLIVEEEQKGKKRAEYGKELSKKLIKEFGRGFSVDNLENMRRFYLVYSKSETLLRKSSRQKSETVSRKLDNNNLKHEFKLSWSHYLNLIKIDNDEERKFYEIEAIENNWSIRELRRQFNSALYERLVLSRDKKGVKELSEKGQIIEKPEDTLKDLYIMRFSS